MSPIAYTRIVCRYDTDGNLTSTELEMGAAGEHPDLLDELAARALRIYQNLEPADEHAAEDGEKP